MKVIHLISGGDTGGAKTHVLSLLQNLNKTITARMVCFRDGPFADEARAMGIPTDIMSGKVPAVRKQLLQLIREEGYQVIHCHGARANMIGAMLRMSLDVPVVTTVHSAERSKLLRISQESQHKEARKGSVLFLSPYRVRA